MHKAIFLDKDQTLISDIPYNVNPKLIELMPEVGEGLKRLQKAGYQLVVVSNQSGVARGYFKEEDLGPVWQRIQQLLNPYGARIDAFYYCPHHPKGQIKQYSLVCDCRKPEPGLIYRATQDLNIGLRQSWMFGDILEDMAAGKRAGLRTVLINTGGETEWKVTDGNKPDFIVKTFTQAVAVVLKAAPPGSPQENIYGKRAA